jgi:hypothetical protein
MRRGQVGGNREVTTLLKGLVLDGSSQVWTVALTAGQLTYKSEPAFLLSCFSHRVIAFVYDTPHLP